MERDLDNHNLRFYVADSNDKVNPVQILNTLHTIPADRAIYQPRPFFNEIGHPQQHIHQVVMIGAPGNNYENKVVGEEGMLLFTPGIADCIAIGIVELNTARTNAKRMSMIHFKSGDYQNADWGHFI